MIPATVVRPKVFQKCIRTMRHTAGLGLVLVVLGCAGGDKVGGGIEPQAGAEYLIVRPANYDPKFNWPLIVVCHGGFPDSPKRQIAEWSKLADDQGFIVAASQLEHRRSRGEGETLPAQTQQILRVVQQVQAGHSISSDRVLIYGVGRGAATALHTALLHPEVFRAVSLNSPLVPGDSLSGEWGKVDPNRPIHVRFSSADRLRQDRYRALVEWLRSVGANVQVDRSAAAQKDRPAGAVAFFELLLRRDRGSW